VAWRFVQHDIAWRREFHWLAIERDPGCLSDVLCSISDQHVVYQYTLVADSTTGMVTGQASGMTDKFVETHGSGLLVGAWLPLPGVNPEVGLQLFEQGRVVMCQFVGALVESLGHYCKKFGGIGCPIRIDQGLSVLVAGS